MKNNIHYLKQSINNPEKLLDESYIFSDWDKNINLYVEDTKKLKEILTTIKILKNKKMTINNGLYIDIINLLNSHAKKSELACFFTACDYNLEKVNEENIELVKEIIDLFLEKRGICEFTYKEWIQAILDSGSSRKKGKCGENKLINTAISYNYKLVNNIKDFLLYDKVVVNLAKNGDFSIKNIKNKLNIDLDFKNQNKILDILIKNKDHYFFIEAKHIKSFGGEQDKQINELINIIRKNTNKNNIHFVAFLDGNYSNYLLSSDIFDNKNNINNKLYNQQKDIINALNTNKMNLWLNTYSFKELLKDLR